jgi:glycosyltransferase involved in cell wall biosynthesis
VSGPPRLLEVLYSFDSGGSERIGAVLATGLAARGWPVEVAATHAGTGPVADALATAGIPCHGLDVERHGRLMRRWAIFRLCRRLRPEVLHIQHVPMFLLCFWPAWLAGVRHFVVTEHTDYQLRTEPRIRRRFRRYARFATRVTVIHEGLARYLVDEVGVPDERIRVVVNGVDSESFAPAARDPSIRALMGVEDPDAVVIGCVARLHPDKDHATLIRAFARMREAQPRMPAHLVLIGDGQTRPEIEALIREAGLGASVHLLGDRGDVPRLMPQFDVLALASRTEGLPMVLLEAMASGVPCVATAVGGIPALLTDGAGELVAAGDVEGFAAALGRYVCDERQRRQAGMSARERVLAGYRECDMIEDYARELATA